MVVQAKKSATIVEHWILANHLPKRRRMFTTVFEPSFVSTDEEKHSAINSFVYNIISPYYINGRGNTV